MISRCSLPRVHGAGALCTGVYNVVLLCSGLDESLWEHLIMWEIGLEIAFPVVRFLGCARE